MISVHASMERREHVILTGTPHEVAFGHQRFLRKGDIAKAEIEKIGALVNPVEVEE